MKNLLVAIFSMYLVGCSTHPDEYTGVYSSPLKYKELTCLELASEISFISNKVAGTYSEAKKERYKDVALTTAGVLVFLPALFFLDGDELDLNRYGYLKSELEALQVNAKQKQCDFQFKNKEFQ